MSIVLIDNLISGQIFSGYSWYCSPGVSYKGIKFKLKSSMKYFDSNCSGQAPGVGPPSSDCARVSGVSPAPVTCPQRVSMSPVSGSSLSQLCLQSQLSPGRVSTVPGCRSQHWEHWRLSQESYFLCLHSTSQDVERKDCRKCKWQMEEN